MAIIDEEEKRKRAEERRAATQQYQQKREELLAQNEAITAQKQTQEKMAGQKASYKPMTGAQVEASIPTYSKKKPGDNNMAKVAEMYGKESADVSSMSFEDAMGFATRIVYDDERDDFLKRWQASEKKRNGKAPTLEEMRDHLNRQKPGGLYSDANAAYSKQVKDQFAADYKAIQENKKNQATISAQMTALSGLTDLNGNAVDVNTASLEEIIRSIKADPDKGRRTAFAGAVKELTKTPGSRFYGVEFDDSAAKEFINSAALTQEDYDNQVERFAGRFNPIEGHERENLDEYAYWAGMIDSGDYSAYVKTAYKRALDAAYRQQTQKDELPDLTGYVPPQSDDKQTEQTDYNWLERLIMGMDISGDDGEENLSMASQPSPVPTPEPTADPTQAPEQEQTVNTSASTPSPTPSIVPKSTKVSDKVDKAAHIVQTSTPVEEREVQGPPEKAHPTLSEAMSNAEFAEAYDAMQALEKEREASIPQGSIDLVHDPIKAAQYALDGKADLLTRETQEAYNKLAMSSPGVRAILRTDVDATQEELLAAQGGDVKAMAYVDGTRKYWATGDASAIIGSTLGSYLALSDSDAFPQELRTAMQGALLEIVVAAEDAYERGEFDYDPKKGTLYDAYIKANPSVMQTVRGVKKAVSDMYLEQRRQEKLASDEAAMNEQALLEEHRAQVRSGTYTPEAYAHVIEKAPLVTIQTARADATYRAMAQEIDIDRTLADGMDDSWHNQMADRYLRENGRPLDLNSVEAMQYKDSLSAYEKDILLSDMRAAETLGYGSLEEMYAAWGGMDIEKLHMRAEALMARDAKEITAQAIEVLDEANSAYVGTGEDANGLQAAGAGFAHGSLRAGNEILEGIWTALSISKEDSVAAMYNLRRTYTKAYGPALATTMYVRAMEQHMQDMSPEHAQAIKEYLDAGYDPFRLGIDPMKGSVLLDASNVLEGRAQSISDWAMRTLNQNQGRWFDAGSSTGSTVTMQTAATLATIVTKNGFVGTMIGYGLPGLNQETKTQLAAGKSRKDALLMGGLRATSDTIANMITSDRFTQKWLGFVGFGPKVALGANAVGDVAASRSVMGMAKKYGAAFLKSAAQTSLEEVVIDEASETLAWQVFGSAGEAYISGANMIKAAVHGLKSIDVMEALDETVKNAGVNFISTLPLAIIGGMGDAVGAGRQAANDALHKSRQAAVELAATGTPEAAEAFVDALASDLEAPEAIDQLNQEMHDAAVAQEAAVIVLTDEEVTPVVDAAEKAQKQADANDAEATASEARMDAAQDAYYERKESGDIDGANRALFNYAKAKQGNNEHVRERDEKREEADAAYTQGMQKAVDKAEAEYAARTETLKAQRAESDASFGEDESFAPDTQRVADSTDRAEQIRARLNELNDAFMAADELNAEVTITPELEEEITALHQELAELEVEDESPEEAPKIDAEAVAAQRAEAEAALAKKDKEASAYMAEQAEREKAQEEADAMLPVYQSLSRKEIYVDDTQRANILSRTGLKTLGQVNRKYGLRLTNDKKKNAPSLDGSTFAELSDLAPGYVPQDVTVSEDALMDIVERKKQLKEMQASVGETTYEQYLPDGAFYSIQDPVMQQLFSNVKKATGVDIVVAPLAGNVRALYDRAENRIIISNRIGAGEISRKVVMHELTHFIEGGAGYVQYKDAVLKAAYAHDKDGSQRKADKKRIFDTYKDAGKELEADGLEKELVAEATEKIITDPDGMLTRQLLGQKQKGLLYSLMDKLGQFLARKKAKKNGNLEQYDLIQKAYDRLKDALRQGGGESQNADPTVNLEAAGRRRGEVAGTNADGQMQFALERDADGQLFVSIEEDILDGLPEKEWAKAVKKALRERFPNGVTVGRNQIKITGKSRGEMTESKYTRWLKNNEPDKYADKLRSTANADELLYASRDYVNEGLNHPRNDHIIDFARGMVTLEVGGNAYTASVVVGTKDDGDMVLYDLVDLEKTSIKKRKQRTAGHQSAPHDRSVASSDTSVTENVPGVNPYSMRDGQQYSLAPNQFGNKTAQELDTIDDAVKDILMGSKHEIVGNDERLDAAWKAVGARGADVVADELLSLPAKRWGAQENVNAALCAVLASRNGDVVTAATILTRYDKEGTAQGQAMQARKLIKRLSPEGAMLEMIRKANRTNAQKGIPAGSFPTGEEAPKKSVDKEREDGSRERTNKKVAEIYHEADELKKTLDALPGDVSYDNPWKLPLTPKQMELIRKFGLMNEKLPGIHYNVATKKQRMLAAILAMDPQVQGDGLKTLCQQLTAIDDGYAVVTAADLRYTASQMAEFRAREGTDATIPKTQEGARALARAYQAQDNVATAGSLKKWTALRFANMLSAPATMVRNIAGNVIAGGLEDIATVVATPFDIAASKKTGTRTTTFAKKDEHKAANAAFASEVVHTASDYMLHHVDTGHGRRYDVGGQGRVFHTEFLETYRNMVDFAMQIGDRPFFEQKYAEEKAIISRLGMKKTEMTDEGTVVTRAMTQQEIHEEATMRALYRVFQEDSLIVQGMNWLRHKHPLADLAVTTLMPFIKTPTNVAMRAIEYSPVGLATTIMRGAARGIDSGKMGAISQRDFVMGIGRGFTGTGIIAAGIALAAAGYIRFGREVEENEGRREVMKAQGIPYGMYLQIGDTMREIDWAMPVAGMLAVGADIYRAMDDGEGLGEAVCGAILNNLGGQILDTPMMSAMNDIFRGYDSAEDLGIRLAKTGATSLLNQTFSPSIIRAIAKATDPYVRDTGADSGLVAEINKSVIQYWPGLRQMLPKATDVTGDFMLNGGYYSWGKENQNAALHFLDSFFTPTATLGEKNDEALFELLDLSYTEGETAFLPQTVVSSSGKLTIDKSLASAAGMGESAYDMLLTEDERREFNRLYGDILFNGTRGARYDTPAGFTSRHKGVELNQGIRKLMESREWERMTGEEKRNTISAMKSAAKELVSYMAIKEYGKKR